MMHIFKYEYLCSYRKAREDEKAASQRLNEMIANYGDVIPRRDFEALEKQHKVGIKKKRNEYFYYYFEFWS